MGCLFQVSGVKSVIEKIVEPEIQGKELGLESDRLVVSNSRFRIGDIYRCRERRTGSKVLQVAVVLPETTWQPMTDDNINEIHLKCPVGSPAALARKVTTREQSEPRRCADPTRSLYAFASAAGL